MCEFLSPPRQHRMAAGVSFRRTLDVGNAAPARLLASGEIGPHSTLARETVSPLALPDAPRGSVFICFPLCAKISRWIPLCAQTLPQKSRKGSNVQVFITVLPY